MTEFPTTHREEGFLIRSKPFTVVIVVSILLLSAASLVFSLYTGSALNALVRENARLVRASSTPLLSFATNNVSDEGDPSISFVVTNSGTGPARVIWFQIRNHGTPYGTVPALAQSSGAPLTSVRSYSRPLMQTLLRPGEERDVIIWNRPAEDGTPEMAAWQAVERDRFNYVVEACYCSLLGDCWQSTLDGDDPRPVSQCRAEGRPSFGNVRVLRRVAGEPVSAERPPA